ncbi:MAG: PhnD/SsuA/transferrin family substrate-binding protein [Roseitalea porphyridii]|jgi:ABC-type phosphate/phosphonate transport system substrate-binding protein|uniref:PhnD/SsuA/transferrin family substrate-binding protein n=1 Tax=Roseitalea porphyridii TaxID=1852022 RepID=UPI0032F05400
MIAGLPMYDWPERRAGTDALWARLRDALRAAGFDAPDALTRTNDPRNLWLSDELLLGETCSYPLETILAGKVRYVATPVHDAPGCGQGTYRSVLVAPGDGEDMPPPAAPGAQLPDRLAGTLAANEPGSMSGYIALARDCERAGREMPVDIVWTGSHRASIRAAAAGRADIAAIDCVTWRIARDHEPAAAEVRVVGWTAERPGLPLITNAAMADADIARLREAVASVMPVVVLDPPTEG